MHPSVNSVISPTLLFPASRIMPRNGSGVSNITKSRTILVAA